MKTVFLVLAGLAVISCAFAGGRRNLAEEARERAIRRHALRGQQSDKILGGDDAAMGQFPWQASMDWVNFGHLCGGSILSENFIVTAAHCVEAFNEIPSEITMRVGLTDLAASSEQRAAVKTVYKHEDYDSWNIVNDIAILELAEPLELNENVQPITLGVGLTPDPEGQLCTASGWGATDSGGWIYPDDLQYVNLDYYTDEHCASLWGTLNVDYFDDSYFCAGQDSGDSTCFGDSGGPLVCQTLEDDSQQYLFGATSFGYMECGYAEYPSVWTDLVNFIDWIEDKTGPLPRPQIK